MNNEYRIAKGWRLFLYVVMPAMAAVFIYLGLSPFLSPPNHKSLYIIFPLLSVGLNALIAWGFLDLYRERLVVQNDRIVQVSAFRTKELPFSAVKGFTQEENYVIVHPAEEGFSPIKISKYTGRLEELKENLSTHFRNLDVEAYEAEEQQLLEAEELGETEDERVSQLNYLRKMSRIINGFAWACAAWLLFFPQPYALAVFVTAALIPVVLYIVHRYKGMVKLDESPKSAYPNLSTAFVIPSLMVGLRSLLDYTIFQYSQLWIWVGGCAAVLYGITVAVSKAYKDRDRLAKSLLLLLFIAFFSYGVVVQYNCTDDRSAAQVYEASVLSKRISSGKHTTYYLELEPWGPQKEKDEVAVSKELYNRVETSQVMQVYFKKGRAGIPWFFVTD